MLSVINGDVMYNKDNNDDEPFTVVDGKLDTEWQLYKNHFGKNYANNKEELTRRTVWENNLKHIQRHNLLHDMGKSSYTMGVNKFTDLTTAEYRARHLAKIMTDNNTNNSNDIWFKEPLNMATLPSEVDWRKKGYVTHVKDQGHCGSCWAFGSMGSLEGQYFRSKGHLVSFSEQQLLECSQEYGNIGCYGGSMIGSYMYIRAKGIMSDTDYPYTGKYGKCHYDQSKVKTKLSGFVKIPEGDENRLKTAVATIGPISSQIDAGTHTFRHYKGGVYDEPNCNNVILDHGVVVVGYGNYSGKPYWLVKNSWGADWGQSGYIMMSRNQDNQCGIASKGIYPII